MNLESVAKYITIYRTPIGVTEVLFSGLPCFTLRESDVRSSEMSDTSPYHYWECTPTFAKVVMGIETWQDLPRGSVEGNYEDAIAEAITKLWELNAFKGVDVDYTQEDVDLDDLEQHEEGKGMQESVELDEAHFSQHMKKAIEAHEKGDEKKTKYHLDNAKTARYSLKSTEITKHKDMLDKYKELRSKYMNEDHDELDEDHARIINDDKKKEVKKWPRPSADQLHKAAKEMGYDSHFDVPPHKFKALADKASKLMKEENQGD